MAATKLIGLSSVVVLIASFYQLEVYRIATLGLGLGRTLEPLSSFPYQCRRLQDPRLQACEDMWLSESTRQLFLACSEPLARPQWLPNIKRYNVSGRSLTDAIYAIDIDEPVGDGFQTRQLHTVGYEGIPGDGYLYPLSVNGHDDPDGSIRIWTTNMKPSIDLVTGSIGDQTKVGSNTTVELFRTGPRATSLTHIKTFSHPQISTPNRIAPVGSGNGFHFTNDHGTAKVGLTHELAPFLGWGDVSFCDDAGCRQVASGLKFPNGLTRGRDGRIYVPSSLLGVIDVFEPSKNGSLTKVDSIDTGYSLDNLAVDKDGDIFAAAFPVGKGALDAYNDPLNHVAPTAAFRITKKAGTYEVAKVIEDGSGEILPISTTVIHDATTGRLFFSSVISPFVAVCEKTD